MAGRQFLDCLGLSLMWHDVEIPFLLPLVCTAQHSTAQLVQAKGALLCVAGAHQELPLVPLVAISGSGLANLRQACHVTYL